MINPVLFHVVNICIIYTSLASKCLADEAWKVHAVLETGIWTKAEKNFQCWWAGRLKT
jgi:cobalamin biosynthesis protein CobD/CbiB